MPLTPKTRSGKIMRRLLGDLAEGREVGDATTLTDPSIIDSIDFALNGSDPASTCVEGGFA